MKRSSFVKVVVVVLIGAFVLSSAAQAATVIAGQGKAIQYKNKSGVWISEDRLATRNAGTWNDDPALNTLDAKKAYLQFNLNDLYTAYPGLQGNITSATLTIYSLTTNKAYNVSGLNNGINEAWLYTSIDWFSAPGNLTNSGTGLIAEQTVSLYAVAGGSTVAGQPNSGDVTTFLNTDTDGLVTFIFTAGGTAYMNNCIPGTNYNAALVPVLTIVPEPATMILLGLGGLLSLKRRHS